jgi:hypothetical protein
MISKRFKSLLPATGNNLLPAGKILMLGGNSRAISHSTLVKKDHMVKFLLRTSEGATRVRDGHQLTDNLEETATSLLNHSGKIAIN